MPKIALKRKNKNKSRAHPSRALVVHAGGLISSALAGEKERHAFTRDVVLALAAQGKNPEHALALAIHRVRQSTGARAGAPQSDSEVDDDESDEEKEDDDEGDEGVFVEVSSPEPVSASSFDPVAAAGLEGLSEDEEGEG